MTAPTTPQAPSPGGLAAERGDLPPAVEQFGRAMRQAFAAARAGKGTRETDDATVATMERRMTAMLRDRDAATAALREISGDAPETDPRETEDYTHCEDAYTAGRAAQHFDCAEIARRAL